MASISDPDTAARESVLVASRALVGIAARSLVAIGDDVSLPQFRILVLVDAGGPQSMGDLARHLAVAPSTVTRLCDRLEDKDFVSRRPADSDRRTIEVHLSAKGRRLMRAVTTRRRTEIDRILAAMTPEARRRMQVAFAEFAAAAGEADALAWRLGWPGGEEDRV